MEIAPWLSSYIRVGPASVTPNYSWSCLSQMASWVATLKVMYSASTVDRATQLCFLLDHVMAPPPSRNTFPEVDHWSFTSPAQSASE